MPIARANFRHVVTGDDAQFTATMRRLPVTAGRAAASVGRKLEGMGRKLAQVTARAAGLVAKMAKIGAITAAIAIPAAAIVGTRRLFSGLKKVADLGGRLSDLSARTGVAVKQLAVLQQAFEDNGVSGDKVADVLNKMGKSIDELRHGLSTQKRAFGDLGLTFSQLSSLKPEQQFALIQKQIAGLGDESRRSAAAMNIFGRSGAELLTLFRDGAAIGNAAKTLGTQADILDRNAAKFDRISDLLANAGSKVRGFFVGTLDKVAAPMLQVLEKWNATDFAAAGQRFGERLRPLFDKAANFGKMLVESIETGTLTEKIGNALASVAANFGKALAQKSAEALLFTTGKAFGVQNGVIRGEQQTGRSREDVIDEFLAGKGNKDALGRRLDAIIEKSLDGTASGPFASKPASDPFAGVGQKPRKPKSLLQRFIDLNRTEGDPFAGGPAARPATGGGTFGMLAKIFGFARSNVGQAAGAQMAGFSGLANFHTLQARREAGIGPGVGNLFARDRDRLGIASGLTTGGLGEIRKVGGEKEAAGKKRDETLGGTNQRLDRSLDLLEEQNSLLSRALI